MNKISFYQSSLVLALCSIVPACTSPAVDADDTQLPADDSAEAAPGAMHKTPSVPVMIDGAQYAPEDIHRFDGRPLYMMVDLAQPDLLVGFTKQSDFHTAVAAKKAAKDSSIPSQFGPGQYTNYYSSDECTGDVLTINSGLGVNDLRAVPRGCGLFGCAGDWNDVISSLWVNGSQTLNADNLYGGGWLWVGGWGCLNMSTYGFDNIGSSLNVW
jgi:hypothetical protein